MNVSRGRAGARLATVVGWGLLSLLVLGVPLDEAEAGERFPKVANIYFPTLIGADLEALAKWDVLVLPKRAQTWYQDELTALRQLNPDIKILVHMPVGYNGSWMGPEDNAVLTVKLNECDWWLRDVSGARVMANQQDGVVDMTLECSTDTEGRRLCDWLPEYIDERLGPGGWWDGAFLDFCMSQISWMNSHLESGIDSNRDGVADTAAELDATWDAGMRTMVTRLRELVGDEYIIVTNGNNAYFDVCDGSTREDFPKMHGDWYDNIANPVYGYLAMSNYRKPVANIINTMWWGPSTLGGPVRTPEFERKFGFTFASTLVFGDGYYSLSGPYHSDVWWHEYFDLDLGTALGGAEYVAAMPGKAQGVDLAEMLRCRRFEKGLAAVNPTNSTQTLTLPGFYYPPESWNGDFYPRSEARMSVTVGIESGVVMVGSGRLLPMGSGLHGWRVDGANCLQWPHVEGADRYSVYRVDIGSSGEEGEMELVDVVSGSTFEDESARTSRSKYFVAPIDEIGCEGQLSCPVEVSSGLGSDLSLALVAVDEPDGTLALTWYPEEVEGECRFDVLRTDASDAWVLLTEEPVDPATGRWVDATAEPGCVYLYEAAAVQDDVGGVVIGSVEVETAAEREAAGAALSLRGCRPHPMVESTTFEFDVHATSGGVARNASLTIYDVGGRVVRRLFEGELVRGPHSVTWDGRSESGDKVASGCYLYAVSAGDEVRSGKVVVVR